MKLKFVEANKYNAKRAGKLWKQDDLPLPMSFRTIPIGVFSMTDPFMFPSSESPFAAMVALFQKFHGLDADGKLGPDTWSLMRSIKEVEHPEVHEPVAPKAQDGRMGVSNCIIIDGRSVRFTDEMISKGITASNYEDDDEHQFTQYRQREVLVTFLVIHESVTMSVARTNYILNKKRESSAAKGDNDGKGWDFGIHLNLAPDGHVSCHADLIRHRLVHANQLDDQSIGIEVVNPYNPKFAKPPFDEVITGDWWTWEPEGGERMYTLPTDAQLRAIPLLSKFLTDNISSLPLAFPTKHLMASNTRIEGWEDRAIPASPGIVAHRDFASHADGRYLLEHCIAELNKPLHARS